METSITACFIVIMPRIHRTIAWTFTADRQFDEQVTSARAMSVNDRRFREVRAKANVIGDSIISKLNTMINPYHQMLLERPNTAGRNEKFGKRSCSFS